MDGEHFIAAPNCGTALCLASVNLFPSPKSDEPPEAAFHRLRFRTEHHLGRSVSLLLALSTHTNVLRRRNLRQPFSRKSPGAVVYIACILDDPSSCEHLNTVQGLTQADAPQRATPQYYGMAYSQAIRRLPFIGRNLRPGCARASRDRVRSPTAPQPGSPLRCRSC